MGVWKTIKQVKRIFPPDPQQYVQLLLVIVIIKPELSQLLVCHNCLVSLR